ncbi:MAG: hypothetical protein ABR543_18695 [Gemmatimonadaceae bacterium]
MAVSLNLSSTVANLALTSVSLMGAGLAPAMAVRVLGWRYTGRSLLMSVLAGIAVATVWRTTGNGAWLNEAAPGMFIGLVVNFVVATKK